MSSWCWWWHPGWNYGPKINLASHRGKSQRWSSNCPSREPRSVRWKFKWKKRINTWKLTSGTLNHHVRRFPTFQVPTGCLTFWKVTRRGAFFVCTMFMPLRWEYPVWTFHPPKSPKFGSFCVSFPKEKDYSLKSPKKAWSLWELQIVVGRSLSVRTATGVSTVRHSPVDPGIPNCHTSALSDPSGIWVIEWHLQDVCISTYLNLAVSQRMLWEQLCNPLFHTSYNLYKRMWSLFTYVNEW